MKSYFKFLILLFVALLALGAATHPKEKEYVKKWQKKNGGEIEVTMPDRTRCDLVTKTHAIEFDFAAKWAEAIGQSLNYSFQTNKRAGIVLIVTEEKDYPKFVRLNSLVKNFELPIDVWLYRDF